MSRPSKTLSSREFNQHTSDAKKAADNGPVFITDRGKPAHVLLSIEEYRRITFRRQKIADSAIFWRRKVIRRYSSMLNRTCAGFPRSVMNTGPLSAAFLASLVC